MGEALIQDNYVYFGLKYGNNKEGNRKEHVLWSKAELFTLALQMRKNPTEAESAMWKILRKFRQSGFPFRRQHPIEFYIADFYCHNLRLVVEVDGEVHTEKEIQSQDEGRTGELERFGIKVLRFTNSQILNDSDLVVEKINATIKELTTTS